MNVYWQQTLPPGHATDQIKDGERGGCLVHVVTHSEEISAELRKGQ
jgi:hypothetical protein